MDYYDKLRDQAAIEIAASMAGAVATNDGCIEHYYRLDEIPTFAAGMANDLVDRLRGVPYHVESPEPVEDRRKAVDMPAEDLAFWRWVVSLNITEDPRGDFIDDTMDFLRDLPGDTSAPTFWKDPGKALRAAGSPEAIEQGRLLREEFQAMRPQALQG